MVNVMDYTPVFTYTDEPFQPAESFDGSVDIETYKARLRRYNAIELGRRNKMLQLRRAGSELPLYHLSASGYLRRTYTVSKSTREKVYARDLCCVWCASEERLEVDHIVRYADGGADTLDNLRLLCHACHATRGGRS